MVIHRLICHWAHPTLFFKYGTLMWYARKRPDCWAIAPGTILISCYLDSALMRYWWQRAETFHDIRWRHWIHHICNNVDFNWIMLIDKAMLTGKALELFTGFGQYDNFNSNQNVILRVVTLFEFDCNSLAFPNFFISFNLRKLIYCSKVDCNNFYMYFLLSFGRDSRDSSKTEWAVLDIRDSNLV